MIQPTSSAAVLDVAQVDPLELGQMVTCSLRLTASALAVCVATIQSFVAERISLDKSVCLKLGVAIINTMLTIAMTTKSSMSVKPRKFFMRLIFRSRSKLGRRFGQTVILS
ncbi:MAG: hypothetical protein AUK52_09095 [Comamonadaceae bacterium CG2_30_60_41]|nr:MAG: hypothetical protein AUK52_09095 [Comamonadaceae bacterium CG2_30_60_41]